MKMKTIGTEKLGLMEGWIKIFKVFPGKPMELVFSKDNLITNAGKLAVLTAITTEGAADPITSLQIGSGGTIDPAGLYPLTEDPTQTALHSAIISLTPSITIDTANLSVLFTADLGQAQGNGFLVSELGLFTDGGIMFNVKNHPGINKSSQFSIHYEWTIRIT